MDMNGLLKCVDVMIRQASESSSQDAAVRFSQAACNAANAIITMQNIEHNEKYKVEQRDKE